VITSIAAEQGKHGEPKDDSGRDDDTAGAAAALKDRDVSRHLSGCLSRIGLSGPFETEASTRGIDAMFSTNAEGLSRQATTP